MPDDAIEAALDVLKDRGPEFGSGLSNHGPMAAEALVAMGRGEEAERWSEWYANNLGDMPQARNPIAAGEWREALGDIGRAGDWSAFFARELDERPWGEAVALWAPRLAPGIMAGATHGFLRTAHAVRSLERHESAARVRELGEGLAYWAARYQELPSLGGPRGTAVVADAVGGIPRVPDERRRRGLIFDAVRAVDPSPFAEAVNAVSVDLVRLDEFVSDLTRTFVRWYLANRHAAIAFIHTVTTPSALRTLAPHLDDPAQRELMWYAWQACAAIYAAYAHNDPAVSLPEETGFDTADLIAQAVAACDEHAIKFTEACLREHRLTADPAFIAAARDAVQRLRA